MQVGDQFQSIQVVVLPGLYSADAAGADGHRLVDCGGVAIAIQGVELTDGIGIPAVVGFGDAV